jgi:hypothetical protein
MNERVDFLLFLASFTISEQMFQNNQYARFLSGYIVFTITLFEAAGILESRFDTTIDTVWILCPVVVVFLLRLGTWIYAAASAPSSKEKPTQPKPPASWSKALNLVLGVAFLGLLGFYLVSEDGTEVFLRTSFQKWKMPCFEMTFLQFTPTLLSGLRKQATPCLSLIWTR